MSDILGDESTPADEDTNVSRVGGVPKQKVVTPYDWSPIPDDANFAETIAGLANKPEAIVQRPQGTPEPLTFKRGEREPSFGDKLTTSFSMFNSVSNLMDADDLWSARVHGADFNVSDKELLKGVPEEYHPMILSEAVDHNEQSALMMRDQLIQDVANNKVFDNMDWYAQLGYGALATIADPLSIVPATAAGKGVQVARAWEATGVVKNTAVVGSWAGGGALEGASMNAPRLSGDHTYTVQDYEMDILVDSVVGFGLGGIGGSISVGNDWWKAKKASDQKLITEKEQALEQQQLDLEQPKMTPVDIRASTERLMSKALDVSKTPTATNPNKQKFTAAEGQTNFEPIGAVDKVSAGRFKVASDTVAAKYPANSPMRKLINNQIGLNKKKLPDDVKEVADKLNADIVRLMSVYPNNKIPSDIQAKISGVTWTQVRHKEVNALDNILTGKTADTTGQLKKYVSSLEKQDIWGGFVPPKVSTEQFYREQSQWLGQSGDVDAELGLSIAVPKELSYLKDLVELNKLAAEKQSAEFTELVERINGMALRRAKARQSDSFSTYKDSTKSWGKSVPMSPPEIAKQLKAEGLKPKTPEYKARLEQLKRDGRAAVSDDINQLGKLDERVVGRQVEELQGDDAGKLIDLKSVDLVSGNDTQDLLPRKFTETEKSSAYKQPTKESLETLRQNIRSSLLKDSGVLTPVSKKESFAQQARLVKLTRALHTDRKQVIDRLIKSGEIENVIEVIRAANKLDQLNVQKPEGKDAVKNEIKKLTINEEHLDQLHRKIQPTVKLPLEEIKQIEDSVATGYEYLQKQSAERWSKALTDFVGTGEQELFKEAIKPTGILDGVGRLLTRWTEDLASKFLKSDLTSMNYIGARIPELGRGFGGRIKRHATGGIVRDHTYRESLTMIAKPYVNAVEAFAKSKGRNAVSTLYATQRAGADDKLVKEFNRSVFEVQELRRQGRNIPERIDQSVLDFVDQWNRYMDKNHDTLVTNGIGGFTKDRKVKNYIPHVWLDHKFNAAIDKHGREKVIQLLQRAYVSSSQSGTNPITTEQAREAAESLIDNVLDDTVQDMYSPVSDSRAKKRMDLDTTTTIDDLSVMDLLDDEVIQVGAKYSNRVAGWVGLSKSTDGNISSQLDIDVLRANIVQEGKDKGVDTSNEEQYFDDLIDLMFGRPTRGGLTSEIRQFKDLTALTRMGGLGTAQLIESGQVLTRGVLQTMSDPKVANKLFKAAKGTEEHNELVREIQSISSITDDMEWLDRQSVHLDQAELQEVNKARQVSLYMADKATWGSSKAPASRLLGKISGYNAIRRIQSRVTQASFTLDVANHFRNNTGKMGSARMADLGLTDTNGKNIGLAKAFRTHADWDENGNLIKLNFDKWSKVDRETFQYALIRDEAQQIMRAHVGELPPWMNKPLMGVIFQFRQMPILAQGKSLSRSLAFGDKEAVLGVMLNTALAGVVRYSKFAALGTAYYVATGEEQPEKDLEELDIPKYITQLGMYADMYDLVLGNSGLTTIPDAGNSREGVEKTVDTVKRQVPVLGLMKDYIDTAQSSAQLESNLDSAQGLVPLGNTALGEVVFKSLISAYED